MSGLNIIDEFYVKAVLPELGRDERQSLFEKIEKHGVKKKEHLKYIEASDLIPPLNTVQARMLKERWNKELKPSNSPSTTDETENVSKQRKSSDIRPDPCGATDERMDESDSEKFKGTRNESSSIRIENSKLVDSGVHNVGNNADISYGPRDDKEEKQHDRQKDKQEGKKARPCRPTNNGTNKNGQISDHQTTISDSILDGSSVNNIGGNLTLTYS